MKTITDFATDHGITLEYSKAYSNPNMPDEHGHKMNHWAVKLTNSAGEVFTLHFSKGDGLRIYKATRKRFTGIPRTAADQQNTIPEPPQLDEVLDCLASDTCTIENARTFSEWCDELGYDDDSRKAERTYNTCVKQAAEFRDWLGADATEELLYQTERL